LPAQKPNILFILTDQMRWDCLSAAGHPVVETPNLDGLCSRGVRFTAAYSSCPSCIAARASIFTGLTPSTHGRLGYQDQVPWRYDHMLAEVLGAAGYQTHCVGKTHFYPQRAHLGFQSLDSYECRQNFDGKYVNDYDEWLRERTGGRVAEPDHGLDSNSWVARPSHLPEELHNNTWVAAKSIEFLRRRDRTRPFFLNMSFHRPHPPIDPPQVFFDLYRGRPLPLPAVGDWAEENDRPADGVNCWRGRLSPNSLDMARWGYYAQIGHIDNQIGRVLRAMTQMRLGPTIILFTSDHGEMLGDHHLFRKTYAYQGSAAVPLIAHGPGVGTGVCGAPVVLEDVYPTLLGLAGVPLPKPVEGVDLSPLLADPSRKPERAFIHGEHSPCYGKEGMQFMTDGKTKYVWMTLTGREQLFDLENDPCEVRDLAAQPRAKALLEMWRGRMIERLAGRPQDGLSDGRRLTPGRNLPAVRPELLA